jgi:hypothetical protein
MSTFEITQALDDGDNAKPNADDPDDYMGREILERFPAICPFNEVTFTHVRLPICITTNRDGDLGLEFGVYDLDSSDVSVLKTAIASWDLIVAGDVRGIASSKAHTRETAGGPADPHAESKAKAL